MRKKQSKRKNYNGKKKRRGEVRQVQGGNFLYEEASTPISVCLFQPNGELEKEMMQSKSLCTARQNNGTHPTTFSFTQHTHTHILSLSNKTANTLCGWLCMCNDSNTRPRQVIENGWSLQLPFVPLMSIKLFLSFSGCFPSFFFSFTFQHPYILYGHGSHLCGDHRPRSSLCSSHLSLI